MLINSLLDTDLYKLTMMQVVHSKFPTLPVKYKFKLRNKNVSLVDLQKEIENNIFDLEYIRFTDEELDYLIQLNFFKPMFIEYLKTFQLNPEHVKVSVIDDELDITIEGTWLETILFEVPILAIVNELFFSTLPVKDNTETWGFDRLVDKINLIKDTDLIFADFGTRRRYSFAWQNEIIKGLHENVPNNFIGTSNVFFAKKYGIKPIGTMSHEYLQAFQAIVHPRHSQKEALEVWSEEYDGKLGIALTDVINMDAFLRDFSLKNTKLYDGLRHDSGCPFEWGDKAIAHYVKMGINPMQKTLVFSDGLTVPKAIEIHDYFKGKINTSFGIGTNLTNDVGFVPLNIVIKMVSCDGLPVAKVSDSAGKSMCKNEAYMTYLKDIFNV